MARRPRILARAALGVMAVAALGLGAAAVVWRGELARTALDPKQPFQTYTPPPAPDYAARAAWALFPADAARPAPGDPPADVFFAAGTTYDGGRDWNGPVDDPAATRRLFRSMLPNYAGPFARVGRVFAPRYRQASLFAFLTLHDDAQEARRFAYGDMERAFDAMVRQTPPDRPLVLAGVGQGASLITHLLQRRVDGDPRLMKRLAAVYLIDSVTPAAMFARAAALPACHARDQARCVVGWATLHGRVGVAGTRRLDRALFWTPDGRLQHLAGAPALCVNPLTGSDTTAKAPARLNLGAANATGLEWGARAPVLPRQVSAQCVDSLLEVSRPASPALQPTGSWADRRRSASYNVFYADIEADAQARVQVLVGRRVFGPAAPPISQVVDVKPAPIHRID